MTDQLTAVARATRLSQAESWGDAAAQWEGVVRDNPVNGAYWDWLGETRYAAGDHAGALTAYRKALQLGAWDGRRPPDSVFPGEIAYRIARCHARLGDREAASAALTEAVALGLRDPAQAVTDEHLASLHGDPRLHDLIGPTAMAATSRVDGWRADLRTLAREAMRRSPARHRVGADFNDAVARLDRDLTRLSDVQIVVEMWRLLRMLGDGHAFLDVEPTYPQWLLSLPVRCYFFTEGLFVTEAAPEHADLLGSQVLAFDGRPVPDVLTALDPLLTRDNNYGPTGQAPRWLVRPVFLHAVGIADDPGKVTLTVRLASGQISDVSLLADTGTAFRGARTGPREWRWLPETLATPVPPYLNNVDSLYWFERRPEARLLYFQFNGIADDQSEPLARFFRRMFHHLDTHDVGRLVVDLRWNGGGNTLLALPLVHHVIGHKRINRRGGLFVIIGRHTFSAAQNTATFLDRHTNAIFVGEPTGSSPNFVGETAPFRLPYSALEANISDLYWQTSWPLDHRTAIAPDIYAPPTFAAFRDNRDPAMESILALPEELPEG